MTAEPDLLQMPKPLPRVLVHVLHEGDMELEAVGNYYAAEQVRACVSSATEALRAEVAKERDYAAQAANRVLKAELAQRKAEARAERLAEALRVAYRHLDPSALRVSHCKDLAKIDAALEQEAGRG